MSLEHKPMMNDVQLLQVASSANAMSNKELQERVNTLERRVYKLEKLIRHWKLDEYESKTIHRS